MHADGYGLFNLTFMNLTNLITITSSQTSRGKGEIGITDKY